MYILFSFFYLVILLPFSFYAKVYQDILRKKTKGSMWEKVNLTSKQNDPAKQY